MESTVDLNVGGKTFQTNRSTLKSIQGSYLSNFEILNKTILSFDRDPDLFRHVFNAHRNCVVHVPRDVCPILFKQELLFWKIPFRLIAPCCWKCIYETEEEIETIGTLIAEENKNDSQNKFHQTQGSIKTSMFTKDGEEGTSNRNDIKQSSKETLTSKLWLSLEEPASSTTAKIWLFFYILVALFSVVVYIIWLEPSVRVPLYLADSIRVDIFTNVTTRDFLIAMHNEKLRKIYIGFHIMLLSLKQSSRELALLMFSLIIAVVVYGCLMFSAEIQTDMFSSPKIAMWWSLITMTTIGYGDFYPVSTLGYVVGIICAINGIIVLALPIAAIASTFSVLYTRSGDLRKHLAEVSRQDSDISSNTKTGNLSNKSENDHRENGTITNMSFE